MKHLFLFAGIMAFASCHTPPEAYKKGIANLSEKKWSNAIEDFNDVTKEDQDWLDSATQRKNEAFLALMNEGDWKKTFRVLDKYRDDDDFYFAATDQIEEHFFGLIKKGKADSVLGLLDMHRMKLEENIDTVFTHDLIVQCEDSIFSGIWDGSKSLKDQEIYFKREGKDFHAYSNKNESGWVKDAIIYKELVYEGNLTWHVKPKVFQTNYWGDQSSYYSKKGSIELLCRDTLLVSYETLGNERKFSRKK
jgi:hypothetical protein